MNNTIAFWLDYIGGINIVYLIFAILASTQLIKMLFKSFGMLSPDTVRPVPYLAGAFIGWVFIEFSARGAMVGVSAGMIASIGFYAALSYLERDDAPKWQKRIADRLSLK